jgi:hypothetical protein
VINPSTSKLTKQLSLSFSTFELGMDPKGANLYTLGENTSKTGAPTFRLAVISPSSNTVVKTFTVPDTTIRATPWMAVIPDGKRLLITASNGSTTGALDVVDKVTEKLLKAVPLPAARSQSVLHPTEVLVP